MKTIDRLWESAPASVRASVLRTIGFNGVQAEFAARYDSLQFIATQQGDGRAWFLAEMQKYAPKLEASAA